MMPPETPPEPPNTSAQAGLTRIRPPAQARYPVEVQACHVAAGQQVAAGDPLYELRDAAGRRMLMRAPRAGQVVEGPVPTGALIPEGMPVLGLRPIAAAGPEKDGSETDRSEVDRSETDKTETGATEEGSGPGPATASEVPPAVQRERDASRSALLRAIWTADSPDVRWGGVAPVLRMAGLFLLVLLGLQLLLRMVMPDLKVEALILPALVTTVIAALLTLRAVRRWQRRPSPLGLVLPMIALTSAGLMMSLVPDRELDRATGFDPAELPRNLATLIRGSEEPATGPSPRTPAAKEDRPEKVATSATPPSRPALPAASPARPKPDDPQIMPPGCYLQVFQYCNRPYSDRVPLAMVIRFEGQDFPKELCGDQMYLYSYYPHLDSHDTNIPAGYQREMRQRIEDFREGLKANHPECRVGPDTTVTLNIRPADQMDEFSRTCWKEPVKTNYNTPICARF